MSPTCRRNVGVVVIWSKTVNVGDIIYSIFVSFRYFGVVFVPTFVLLTNQNRPESHDPHPVSSPSSHKNHTMNTSISVNARTLQSTTKEKSRARYLSLLHCLLLPLPLLLGPSLVMLDAVCADRPHHHHGIEHASPQHATSRGRRAPARGPGPRP